MRSSATLLSAAFIAALFAAAPAQAQLYRSVGPDGTVTYSDKPPANAAPNRSARGAAGASDQGGGSGGALPYELAQVAGRYPVTLYTAKECAPCDQGRSLLAGRGIPFNEKTVATNDDIAALKRLGNDGNLPMVTIGGQRLNGFSEPDWSRYLDAAGYPKTSQLPSGYQRPAPSPLVAVQVAPVDQAGQAGATPGTAATPGGDTSATPVTPRCAPDNPACIRF